MNVVVPHTMQKIVGSTKPTRETGGTAGLLPAERARASFDSSSLTKVFQGQAGAQSELAKLLHDDPLFDFTYDVHDTRADAFIKSLSRTVAAHKTLKKNPDLLSQHTAPYIGGSGSGLYVAGAAQSSSSAVGNHYGIFVGALLARASEEQLGVWFNKAINLKIFGAYAQTELGHGSNVRALETTATYDRVTDEFVIDSPTLTSMKWWPGCFGLIATHAVVYARLIIDGKDLGVHEFMVQLRDEKHEPMPGVDVGDIGPKLGYNNVDNGYARFDHVRVPRFNMLAKHQEVTADGVYRKRQNVKSTSSDVADKIKYIVMISTRVAMTVGAYQVLAKASTIAIRYSAVRLQGFVNTREDSHASGEHPVLNYQMQQYRLFKALSMAYAIFFAAREIRHQLMAFRKGLDEAGDASALPEIHATAAGLKAFCTNIAGDLIEECRRCCGGHGCTLNSGVAAMVGDYNTIGPIAEGDQIILALQTARFLLRACQAARRGADVPGQAAYIKADDPYASVSFTPESLKDVKCLLTAFQWRARKCVYDVTDTFEAALKTGLSFDDAWNSCAVGLVEAARNHCLYVLLARFVAGIGHLECDDKTRAAVTVLARHYALVQLRERGADWVALLTPSDVANINRECMSLLAEIRPNAVAYVDAFGFKDEELHSAIGRYDGNVYEALFDYARKSPLNSEAFVHRMWETCLKGQVDAKFLAEGRAKQRAGPVTSKL